MVGHAGRGGVAVARVVLAAMYRSLSKASFARRWSSLASMFPVWVRCLVSGCTGPLWAIGSLRLRALSTHPLSLS